MGALSQGAPAGKPDGTKNVLRDHYQEFYEEVTSAEVVRCKHYCVPIVDVASPEELRQHVARLPKRHQQGVVFRGQGKLYTLDRDPHVKEMLFGTSDQDPAYRTMLDFADSAFGQTFGHFVNRFHW